MQVCRHSLLQFELFSRICFSRRCTFSKRTAFLFPGCEKLQLMKILPYILIGIACFALGWFARPGGKAVHDTDTIQSPPIVVTKTKVDTLTLLSPQPYIAWIDNTDTMRLDSCWHLREYKEYRDSNYYVKVSGVQPRLDEVRVYPLTVYQTEYIYRDVVRKERQKRWGVGLGAGYGVGKHGLSPVVAVTVNWNLWQW